MAEDDPNADLESIRAKMDELAREIGDMGRSIRAARN